MIKDFLIIGPINAVTYKNVFPLFKDGKIRPGYVFDKDMIYNTPDGPKHIKNSGWWTTLPTPNARKKLTLTKRYSADKYPKYDNYNAINCNRIADIPYDYPGAIGCPLTIIEYDLDNVRIEGTSDRGGDGAIDSIKNPKWNGVWDSPIIAGQKVYTRIFVKNTSLEVDDLEHIGYQYEGYDNNPWLEGKEGFKRIMIEKISAYNDTNADGIGAVYGGGQKIISKIIVKI